MFLYGEEKAIEKDNTKYLLFATPYFQPEFLNALVLNNPRLMSFVMSGNYFYYDNRLWLCHPDVISDDSEEFEISETASSDIKGYCLKRYYRAFFRKKRVGKSENLSSEMLSDPFRLLVRAPRPPRFCRPENPNFTNPDEDLISDDELSTDDLNPDDDGISFGSNGKKQKIKRIIRTSRSSLLTKWTLRETPRIFNRAFFQAAGQANESTTTDFSIFFQEISDNFMAFVRYGEFRSNIGGGGNGGNSGSNSDCENRGDDLSFSNLFTYLMKAHNVSVRELSERTKIPEKTISRMRSKGYNPSLEYIVICCVAMQLFPWESHSLIKLAGYYLRMNVLVDRCYLVCIDVLYWKGSLEDCDLLFKKNALPPLTSIVKGNKKERE